MSHQKVVPGNRCCYENSRDVPWMQHGCYSVTQGGIGNSLAEYLVMWWLISDAWGTESSSIWRLIFKAPLSEAPLFGQRSAGVQGSTRILLYIYSSCFLNLSPLNFYNLCHLPRNPKDCRYASRKKMCPFVFNLLLAGAHLLPTLNSHYLILICCSKIQRSLIFPYYPSQEGLLVTQRFSTEYCHWIHMLNYNKYPILVTI